jgi:plasmid stabilization system protein ParE
MPSFEVRLTSDAEEDLLRLFNFLLELDLELAIRSRQAIEQSFSFLAHSPFTCRKASAGALGPFLRELLIPFGASGYLALFEIDDAQHVTILAVRHHREDDYH